MRLPVILVQNPPASAAAYAEALVGHLIGRAGLDLTLVNRFDSIASDSTDKMTLDGISVPSAVLDWRTPDELMRCLAELQFHGFRCPHQLDPAEPAAEATPPTSRRRLFLFDLNRHTDVNQVVAELDRLRESLSVKTVSLGNLAPPPQRPAVEPSQPAQQPAATSARPKVPSPDAITPMAFQSDENLDALIDRLDELDV